MRQQKSVVPGKAGDRRPKVESRSRPEGPQTAYAREQRNAEVRAHLPAVIAVLMGVAGLLAFLLWSGGRRAPGSVAIGAPTGQVAQAVAQEMPTQPALLSGTELALPAVPAATGAPSGTPGSVSAAPAVLPVAGGMRSTPAPGPSASATASPAARAVAKLPASAGPTPIPPATATPVPPPTATRPPSPTSPPVPSAPGASLGMVISAEQAVRAYYAMIAAGNYAAAYPLLSDEFNQATGTTTLAMFQNGWRKSGPAVIVDRMKVVENDDEAVALVHLYYPDKDAHVYLRFNMARNISRGSSDFGYWQLNRASYADPADLER